MCDLWIRTQDKQRLLKVDDIVLCYESRPEFENGYVLYPNTHNEILHNEYLGIYSTKEKAMAVMDEIQKALSTIILTTPTDNYTDKDLKRAREFGVLSSPSQTIFDTGCVVYTMPEDVEKGEEI